MNKNMSVEILKKYTEILENMSQEEFNKITKEKGIIQEKYDGVVYEDDSFSIILTNKTLCYDECHRGLKRICCYQCNDYDCQCIRCDNENCGIYSKYNSKE